MAVDAPHAAHPEHFTYKELSQRITAAAAGFRSLGIREGDVVGLFAENSPRWLMADQGLMRAGAADAVRGASAPVEELRYILEDAKAVEARLRKRLPGFHGVRNSYSCRSAGAFPLVHADLRQGEVGYITDIPALV